MTPELSKKTNARRFASDVQGMLADLRTLMVSANASAWAIGDLVEKLKQAGIKVKDQAQAIGASRQRLSELRRTAAAFPPLARRLDRDIQYHTVAARAARRLRLSPVAVLGEIISQEIDSTRAATRYLAERIRTRQGHIAALQANRMVDHDDPLLNHCHHDDYRNILAKLPDGSIKLILADAPYGTYGRYLDGQHTRVASTQRDCDGLADSEARELVCDLFRLASPILCDGGCLILFRPGGLADPPWLMHAAEQYGWSCRHALTWQRGAPKLGDGRAPYSAATERLLVFAIGDQPLINHDGSPRSDVINISATTKSYLRVDQHLFEKPVELMRRLIAKHTDPQEVVVEAFGATGPVSRASIQLGRKWIFCESNARNFKLGSTLIAEELAKSPLCTV